ncbi:GTPase activating protein [Coemansia sp. IMI 203386]|nr:GTPase activating protein [Coemansia sp. IMI 203386]
MGGGPAPTPAPELTSPPSEFSDYCIVSEVSCVKLLYAKSKVYVYRSNDKKDRISGFVCVVQAPDDQYYIAWTPEALLSESDRESYVQVELCPSFFDESTGGKDRVEGAQVSVSMVAEEESFLISTEPLNQAGAISSVANYAFCKPIGDILSLLIHPPSLTSWHGSVIVNLADGTSVGPMWFHDDESVSKLIGVTRHWGGDELLLWLAQAVTIERSIDDPNRYEIRGSKSSHVTLSRSATPAASTILTAPKQLANSSSAHAANPGTAVSSTIDLGGKSRAASTATRQQQQPDILDSVLQGNMDPLVSQAKELQWNILERFSRITRTVKDAANSFIDTPVGQHVAPYIPPALGSIRRAHSASGNLVKEYETARIYLAKWAAQQISGQQHEEGQHELDMAASSTSRPGDRRGSHSNNGHISIWEEWVTESGSLDPFDVVGTRRSADMPRPIRTQPPLSAEQWFGFFEPKTPEATNFDFKLVADPDTVRRAIFAGGIEEDMRPLVWKYLFAIYPWCSTEDERNEIDKRNVDEYWILKEKWVSDPGLRETKDFVEQSDRINKDVLRTDRSLPLFATDSSFNGSDEVNLTEHGLPGSSASLEQMKDILMTFHYYDKASLGYVQGMSDLLAPIYSVYQDEPTTFWAFTAFMKRMRSHFLRDQSGMQDELSTMAQLVEIANPRFYRHLETCDASNMFSCYRWLLIWFKREFGFEDILRLWEVLWTDYLTDRFVLFVALAILQRHADVIMDHLRSPEEILKYIQDLGETIDLNDTLKGAEMCFYKVRHRVAMVEEDRKRRGLPLFTGGKEEADDGEVKKDQASDQATPADAASSDLKKENVKGKEKEQNNNEVALITFEWDDKDASNGHESPSESSKPKAETKTEADVKSESEQPAPVAEANGDSLPEILESVHKIFANGYKL